MSRYGQGARNKELKADLEKHLLARVDVCLPCRLGEGCLISVLTSRGKIVNCWVSAGPCESKLDPPGTLVHTIH